MKLFSLSCSEAGFSDCGWSARAGSDLLLLMMFEDHVLAKHNTMIAGHARNAIRDSVRAENEKVPAELLNTETS
jgi:predicted small metal-binding protein